MQLLQHPFVKKEPKGAMSNCPKLRKLIWPELLVEIHDAKNTKYNSLKTKWWNVIRGDCMVVNFSTRLVGLSQVMKDKTGKLLDHRKVGETTPNLPFPAWHCHLSGPPRLRVQSRSRTRLRIASIVFLFRACFKGVSETIAPLSRSWAPQAV